MPANIYAAIVLSGLAFGAFTVARVVFAPLVGGWRIDVYRNVFIALTAISFLIGNFWLALGAAAIAMAALGLREDVRPALFVAAMFAMPAAEKTIPGFAGINRFIDLTPVFVATVVILLPAMVTRRHQTRDFGGVVASDRFFLAYLSLACLLSFRDVSLTAGLRNSIDIFVTSAPLYYVFSRYNWTVDRLNALAVAFAAQFAAFAGIALLEAVTDWHHYYEAMRRWDASFLRRDFTRSGLLRTIGPFLGSISFGSFFMVAIIMATPLYRQIKAKSLGLAGFAALTAGLITTVSRGPWIATVLALGAKAAVGPRGFSRLVMLGFAAAIGFIGLSFTPFGAQLIDLLPFVGQADADTFDYRQRLLEVGAGEVMNHPLFGSVDYKESQAMQTLVQGQGIIDIVNAYLQIALDTGLVGLALYLGVVLSASAALLRASGRARGVDPIADDYLQTGFGLLIGFAFLIATTTLIQAQTEQVNWMIIGLAVGLARRARRANDASMAPFSDEAATNFRAIDEAPANSPAGAAAGERRPARPPAATPTHLRQYYRGPDRDP